jgi:hypothetical protein
MDENVFLLQIPKLYPLFSLSYHDDLNGFALVDVAKECTAYEQLSQVILTA